MATAQDLVDALDRLTASMTTMHTHHTSGMGALATAIHTLAGSVGPKPTPPAGPPKPRASRFRRTLDVISRMWRRGRSGGALKAMGGRLEKFGSKVWGKLGLSKKTTKGLGKLAFAVGTLKAFGEAVTNNTAKLMEFGNHLAKVSGQMAAVMAEREIREILRDTNKGDLLAESQRFLSDGEQYRKDSTMQIEVLAGRVENYVTGFGERVLGAILEPLNNIAAAVNAILGSSDEGQVVPLGEWAINIAAGVKEPSKSER